MTDPSSLPLLERDANQIGAPPGYSAYIFRWWRQIETSFVTAITVSPHGQPHLHCTGDAEVRPPNFRGETSRIFISNSASIDPEVLAMKAGPIPDDIRYPYDA